MGVGDTPPCAPPSETVPPGRPFPLALLGWAPSNVTFALLFGQRFDYRDPVFVALLGLIDEVMVLLGTPSLQVREVAAPRPQGGGQELRAAEMGGRVSQLPPAVARRAPSAEPPWTHAQVRFWRGEPRPAPVQFGNRRGLGQGPRLPSHTCPSAADWAGTRLRWRPHKPALPSVAGVTSPIGRSGLWGACVPSFPCLGCPCLQLPYCFFFLSRF